MNTLKVLLGLILAMVLIGSGLYFFTNKTPKEETKQVITSELSDDVFLKAVSDPDGKVLAKGDVNNDGYVDAITESLSCGASCSVSLQVVLNNKNGGAESAGVSFEPGFKSSSATKSSLTNVFIENGIILLTGYGLDCVSGPESDSNFCTEEKWNILRTIKFKLDSEPSTSSYSLQRV